jgi:excinuclease ABC subunit C
MEKVQELLEKAKTLPSQAGCYLMKDKNSRVIYVGKAKKLRSRVTSYFDSSQKNVKTLFLVQQVHDFDFIITHSDVESYVLENNLIKKHAPKYNLRLKDDKSYPWVMVNYTEPFPRLEYVRRPKKGKGKDLYGPFPVGSNISMVLRVLTKSFMLRDCSLNDFKSRKTPCLLHQMKQCSAPCVGYLDAAQYEKDLETAAGLFQGEARARKTLAALRLRMQSAAESEEFERAAIIRDHLELLEEFIDQATQQNVESLKDEKDVDVWASWQGEEEFDFSVYMVRRGMLIGQKNFHFPVSDLREEMEEEMRVFLLQYYADPSEVAPQMVVLDAPDENLADFTQALGEVAQVATPPKVFGRRRKYLPLIEMCRKHAEESQRVRITNMDSPFVGLKKLKELLDLKDLPRRLECYDVAIWQGKSPTASQVVSHDGKLDKAFYRHFHLQELPEGNNDFAMMREVFTRRVSHGELPDVFVVDGGVAQVNTVCAVLRELSVEVPVVGIAKSRDLTGDFRKAEIERSEERLVIPGRKDPYVLQKCPPLFRIIVTLRDEAHRFSRRLHHKAESKRFLGTWLDEIEGLGAKTKQTVLKNLTMSKEALRAMTASEVERLLAVSGPQARLIWEHLQNEVEGEEPSLSSRRE